MKRMFVLVAMALLVLFNVRSWASSMYGNKEMGMMQPKSGYDTMAMTDEVLMREQLEEATQEFRLSKSYGEHALGQLLKLLSLESNIAYHLMRGASSYIVTECVYRRQKALHCSIPSVRCLYNQIMDIITYDASIDPELLYLGYNCKQAYLDRMLAQLQEYCRMYANLQYDEYIGNDNRQEMVM
ncbi:MAG TPA: hypothetical protein VGT41_05635 [Candidatus Babeliales bacterium]|nr:hypothetical protein [Candidatus Babeliales bacterium]